MTGVNPACRQKTEKNQRQARSASAGRAPTLSKNERDGAPVKTTARATAGEVRAISGVARGRASSRGRARGCRRRASGLALAGERRGRRGRSARSLKGRRSKAGAARKEKWESRSRG